MLITLKTKISLTNTATNNNVKKNDNSRSFFSNKKPQLITEVFKFTPCILLSFDFASLLRIHPNNS